MPKSKTAKKVNVYYVNWVLPPFRAMTLPPFGIFIKKEFKGNTQVLQHDLIHWQQYKRMGFFLYYFRYLLQLLVIGYDTMPMEMEARQHDSNPYNYRAANNGKPVNQYFHTVTASTRWTLDNKVREALNKNPMLSRMGVVEMAGDGKYNQILVEGIQERQ